LTPVDFYRHGLGDDEIQALDETLRSVFLTTAGKTARFETELAAMLGVEHCVGLSSCTAGLHLSLEALGIGPGDEVIVPAMTFIASINPIWWVGADPVLADVDPVTALLDLDDVAAKITPRTKAIIPVHLYGAMVDMPRLRTLCDEAHIAIIEDAAHCVEGSREGHRPGQLGDVACFSFYATKNLTSGEGGAVVTKRQELAEQIGLMRQHGMSSAAKDRHESAGYVHWDMLRQGYKYNMFDIQAALLLPQLPKVAGKLERREQICQRYQAAFDALDSVDYPRVPKGTTSARHLFTIWVAPAIRDSLLTYLKSKGIGCAVNYRAVHILDYYKKRLGLEAEALPKALAIGNSTISLPLYPSLTDEQVDEVIDAVTQGLEDV
jgi:dTDP-4-amino-4,6-dideoxygalactose transaminase